MTTLKLIMTVVLTSVLLGCTQQPKADNGLTSNQRDKADQSESTIQKLDNSKYYTTNDTLIIAADNDNILKYSKDEFNQIVDDHPELFNSYPRDPDRLYYSLGDKGEFTSEVGRDNYYVLYSYLLKQKNGIDNYAGPRKKLINIYSKINALFQNIERGGTYFGHQYARILAYAEYSVYLYSRYKNNISKRYDISKQKELYMQSMRQLIEDEIEIDDQIVGDEKIGRSKELNILVDDLDKLISDNFYLRRAQAFHYRHYEYY